MQAIQSKNLRTIANAPLFVRNITLHRDLEVEPLQEFIQKRAKKTYEGAEDHDNPLVRAALIYDPEPRTEHIKRTRLMIQDLQPD